MDSFKESENLELKERWTDKALEDLAAFANTHGGTCLIGVRKDGTVVGTVTDDAELQRIANTIVSRLGITPFIRVRELQGHEVIVIQVEPIRGVVPYRGRYLTRVGTVNRDMPPEQLARRLLERSSQTWDGLASPWGPEAINPEQVIQFARLARDRLPRIEPSEPERTLQNLGLLQGDRLTNAGVLLFARRPQLLFPHARLRIGLFRGTQILDSHEFEGTLWQQLNAAMDRFRQVLQVRFDVQVTSLTLEGLQRRETWEYPLEALREAVINALIHRDYTACGDIQIRIAEDRLQIWNPGGLPEGIRIDQLREPEHPSIPRNPLLSRAFYYAGLIEHWGTGTTRILELCKAQGLPEPEFVEQSESFKVVFLKDPYTPERLRRMGLNERQIRIVAILRRTESASVSDLHRWFPDVSSKTIQRDLQALVREGIVKALGDKKGRRYVLVR